MRHYQSPSSAVMKVEHVVQGKSGVTLWIQERGWGLRSPYPSARLDVRTHTKHYQAASKPTVSSIDCCSKAVYGIRVRALAKQDSGRVSRIWKGWGVADGPQKLELAHLWPGATLSCYF